MKYYAVIDTNVFVSALLVANSNPEKIVNYIKDGTIIPIYDQEIMNEYKEVLNREKFNFSLEKQQEILSLVTKYGLVLNETKTTEIFKDSSDIKFFQIVLTANMIQDSYLVTGNIKHFPKRIFVVETSMMVEIIENNK